MQPAIAIDLLNSLRAQIAVLDARGVIVAVNEAWKRFARENRGEDRSFYLGANYLAVCEAAMRSGGDGVARSVRDAVRELLRGDRAHFAIEYPCHTPKGTALVHRPPDTLHP